VLAAAVSLRAAVPLLCFALNRDPAIFHLPDTGDYLLTARQLLAGRFSLDGVTPELFRTPGYPLLLVPGVALGEAAAVTILLQILLSVATVYLVYRASQLLFQNRQAALLASLLYALELQSIVFCSALLSETLFTACLTLFVCFLLAYFQSGRVRPVLTAALALTASIYVRPVAYLLPLAVFVLLLARGAPGRARASRRAVPAAAFVALCAALLVPWHARNLRVAGYPGFSTAFEQSLYYYHSVGVRSWLGGEPYHQALEHTIAPASYAEMRREVLDSVRAHPFLFAWLQLKGAAWAAIAPNPTLLGTLLGHHTDERPEALAAGFDKSLPGAVRFTLSISPAVSALSLAIAALVILYYGLAARAVLAAGPQRTPLLAVVLPLAACLLFLGGGQLASGRFRHPAMPLVCMAAGYGLALVLNGRTRGSVAPL